VDEDAEVEAKVRKQVSTLVERFPLYAD
jgi:hypothetical protein